jgi:hypothetical protein
MPRSPYSFFTALRARSFIHIFTQTHHFPLPQLVQAVTGLMYVNATLVQSQEAREGGAANIEAFAFYGSE